jgi:hypothetical protein
MRDGVHKTLDFFDARAFFRAPMTGVELQSDVRRRRNA